MSKSNKLSKSTLIIAILSVLLIAVLTLGGTYAYFSDKADGPAGTATLGHLEIKSVTGTTATWEALSTTKFEANAPIFTNESIKVAMVTEDTSDKDTNINFFMRVQLDVAVAGAGTHLQSGEPAQKSCGEGADDDAVTFTLVTEDTNWELIETGAGAGWYYLAYTANGYTGDQTLTVNSKVAEWVGANGCEALMDATAAFTIKVEVLQAKHLTGTFTNGTQDLADAWDALVATHA